MLKDITRVAGAGDSAKAGAAMSEATAISTASVCVSIVSSAAKEATSRLFNGDACVTTTNNRERVVRRAPLLQVPQQHRHQTLLEMEAILCLRKDQRLRALQHGFADLQPAIRRQAVQHHGVLRR